jgi:uroporphyrinogen-III synthase
MAALDGQLVVVTRAAHQSSSFVQLLRSFGAEVAHFPVIAIAPPADWGPLDEALAKLHGYDWLIFTSANAVDVFFTRATPEQLQSLYARIAVVGPATARAVERHHRTVDLVADDHIAEGLITAFGRLEVNRLHMLLPRAAGARDTLPDALGERGAAVDVIEVYRNTVPASPGAFPSTPDWVTFTSASTVKNLLALVPREQFADAKLASIGPETSAALRQHHLRVTVEASPSTQEGLAAAMAAWENNQR